MHDQAHQLLGPRLVVRVQTLAQVRHCVFAKGRTSAGNAAHPRALIVAHTDRHFCRGLRKSGLVGRRQLVVGRAQLRRGADGLLLTGGGLGAVKAGRKCSYIHQQKQNTPELSHLPSSLR